MLMTEETTPAIVIGESYRVDGWGGIAFVATRWAQEWEVHTRPVDIVSEHSTDEDDDGLSTLCGFSGDIINGGRVEDDPCPAGCASAERLEIEDDCGDGAWVDNPDRVILVMVGDDREHEHGIDELTPLPREDYCGECGQIGCGHDGLDRV